MFVNSLCVYNHCGLYCFIEYLHRKLLTANFLSDDNEMAEKSASIGFTYPISSRADTMVSSTYANILKYHIQGMPTNILLQVFI